MRIVLPDFPCSTLPYPAVPRKRAAAFSPAPVLLLLSFLFFPVFGYAAEPSALQNNEVVPARTIHLKEDRDVAWKALWDQGRELTRNGRLAEAVPVYEELLVMREGLEIARWELVTILLQLKREASALPHLESLVEAVPGNFQYLLALAEANRGQGNAARAADLYKKVLKRQPDNLQAMRSAASVLLVQQKKVEAAAMLEALLRRDPARLALREELGNIYFEMGDYERARRHFIALVKENKADPAILLKTAQAYEKTGLESQAIEYWQRLARTSQSPEAKERLTAYYLKGGKGEDALAYLLPLYEKEPASPKLLKRIGQIYSGLSRLPEALVCFERYIFLKPEDKEVLRQVIGIHAVLGNKSEATPLMRGNGFDPVATLANLERVAGRYEVNGDFREAVALYDQILRVDRDVPEILAKRAKALLAGGYDAEADRMWAHLAQGENLQEVLEILARIDPGNKTALKKLARMYLERGELSRSMEMFSRLEAIGVRTPDVLAGQAQVYDRLGFSARALALYEQLLDVDDEAGSHGVRCIQLAGELGLLRKTRSLISRLQERFPGVSELPRTQLLIAKALADSASYAAAREYYSRILARSEPDGDLAMAALFGMAETYRQSGLPYEAEQALRQAYLLRPRDEVALGRLFDLSLEERKFAEAWIWLEQLVKAEGKEKRDNPEIAGKTGAPSEKVPDPRLLRARLLAAEGENRDAVKLLRRLAGEEQGLSEDWALSRPEVDLLLARLLVADGRYAEAEPLAAALSGQPGQRGKLAADLLLLRIHRAQGKSGAAQAIFQGIRADFAQDQGLEIKLLRALQKEGLVAELLEMAEPASRKHPESVTVRSLFASAQEANGEIGAAINLWRDIVKDFPEQDFVAVRLARQLFNRGRFAEARAVAESFPLSAARPDMMLLKARILWAEHEWEQAVAIYEAFLQPSVADILAQQGRERGVVLPQAEEPGLWTKLTVTELDRQTVVDGLMEPEALLAPGQSAEPLNRMAVPLYAKYLWHKQFALEKTARQAVMHREYLAAANYFRILLREYPAEPSLQFDLAGIYSRFGQLGHEAMLYEEIASAGGEFPGLAEARMRNELKRMPRVGLGYGYLREEGREGYKAIRKSWEETRLQYSPYLQHDLEVTLARLDYQNPAGHGKIRGTRALVSYAANINEQLLVRGAGGAELLGSGQPDTALVEMAAEGRLGDRLTGIVSYGRDVVHDTLASLGRNVVQEDYKADFVLDMVPSVQVGGGYLHANFSDDNTMKGYDLWAAYLLFFEPAFLKFSYTYDFKDTAEARGGGALLADGFAVSDHPYWTPINYWQNRFSLYFKHQLSDDQFRRGVPRYYDLEYVMVYDEMGYAMQILKGGFFVEYAPQVIFAATTELTSGPDYRSKEFFLSAVYRW